jgi:peptide/nickel transport system substrate-binding protein
MRRVKASVIVVLAVLSVAGVAGAALAASSGPTAAKSQIDRNAVIRTGRGAGAFTTLDPAFNAGPGVVGVLFDRLTQFDPVYHHLYPELATSWAFTKDGSALNMKLRTDVKFHDGSPVNAAAVVANINRYKTLPGSKVAINLGEVSSVQATGAYSVRFNLVPGQGADLPALLSQGIGMIVNPAYFTDPNLGKAPPAAAGSGPYVFKALPSTSELDVTRAPGKFWDPKAGLAKELDIVSIPSTAAGINAFQSGALDGTNVIVDGILQGMALVKSGKAYGTPFDAVSMSRFLFNPRVAPFNNPLLRKAVQAAIDKRGIINGYFAGGCRKDDQPVPLSHSTYDPHFVNTNPYNVAKAKEYLAQAGVPNGFSFKLEIPNFAFFPGQAVALQGELAVVGIKADLVYLDPAVYNARLNSGQWQAFSWGATPAVPDPQNGLMTQFLTGGPSITVGTPLAADATAFNTYLADPTHSTAQRITEFHKLYKWLNDQAVSITICAQTWVYIHKKGEIQNGPKFPSSVNDFRYLGQLKE